MKVHVVREESQSHQSQSNAQYRRFRSEPRWLIVGGLALAALSTLAFFAAQIIFTVLAMLGLVLAIWGCVQWVVRFFQK